MRIFRRVPELTLLIVLAATSYVAMAVFAELPSTEVLTGRFVVGIIVASFLFPQRIKSSSPRARLKVFLKIGTIAPSVQT